MKTLRQKPSLLRDRPLVFSPLYLNTEKISTEKLLALYRFANLFFPKLGPGAVQTLLDMKKHGERLTAGLSPEERRRLIGAMQGLSMEMHYALKDNGEKMMEISINIAPGELLERVRQGKIDMTQYRQLRKDIDRLVLKLVEREVRKRFTAKVEGLFRGLLGKPHIPGFVSRLLDMGWIDRKGRLKKGTTIDDLIAGKYRVQFEPLIPEELLQEGLKIRETINACFAAGVDDADLFIQNAARQHALLEITIGETRRLPPRHAKYQGRRGGRSPGCLPQSDVSGEKS